MNDINHVNQMSEKSKAASDPFLERERLKYEHPVPSREYILEHLKKEKKPLRLQDWIALFGLVLPVEKEALRRRLKAMIRDGQLEALKGGYVWLSGHRVVLQGRIEAEKDKKKGRGHVWVVPEDGSRRIPLLDEEAYLGFVGSRVVVSVANVPTPELRLGKVIEILDQKPVFVTGRFIREGNFCYVIPHNKEFSRSFLIPEAETLGALSGQIVVVEPLAQPQLERSPGSVGRVKKILGDENTPGIEVLSILSTYGLPHEFNEEVCREVQLLKPYVLEQDKLGREDLRSLAFVTIDGEDAKDFDDAVYCEPNPKGKTHGWLLYVAIADVSHYVHPQTALDKEAKLRGNSIYFPGQVIPMLPEILSNELCSLKPDVDRLVLVCRLEISKKGVIKGYEFKEAVIHSHARLTYTKVAQLLKEKTGELAQQYAFILPHLERLEEVYEALKNEREKRGAIDFETVENRIVFSPEGKISAVQLLERNMAHRLIEECMLCANVATARFLKKHKAACLYRNHEVPPPEKIADLRLFLSELGLSLAGGGTPKPLNYAALLKSIQNRPDANVIQMVLLRSMSQAIYSPKNLGHFGLAYSAYCHFTSPIRRYPDLFVHRQIKALLKGESSLEGTVSQESSKEAKSEYIALGEACSLCERRADEATRDVLRWLKCQYMQQYLGESFDGIISGVARLFFSWFTPRTVPCSPRF